jgi:hypothetical protein
MCNAVESPDNISNIVFVTDTQCVFCKVGTQFLASFPYFEKNKRRLMISPCCLSVYPSVSMFPPNETYAITLLSVSRCPVFSKRSMSYR